MKLPRPKQINDKSIKENQMYSIEIKFGGTFIKVDSADSLEDALVICGCKSIAWRVRRDGWTMARSI
jgi:hypothetical protein